MKRIRYKSNESDVREWYLNHYFLLISYVALLFTIDFLRYHYKNQYLMAALYLAAFFIVMIFLYNFIAVKFSTAPLYLFVLVWISGLLILIVSNYGFSYYREQQLRNNFQLSVGKITGRYITTSKSTSYIIEFEFIAGDKTVKDKKYLPKEEWDLYEGEEEVSVFYVPDLPLNNGLMRP